VADVLFGDVNHGGKLPVSYSVFKFANLQLSKTSMGVRETTEVSVDVTNTSSVAGDRVAQLHIHQRYGSASRPWMLSK
jgi:beta-glucosidase